MKTLCERIRGTESSDDAEQVAMYTDCVPAQDWDQRGRQEAALVGMRAKFSQHQQARELLQGTGDKKLVFLDQVGSRSLVSLVWL